MWLDPDHFAAYAGIVQDDSMPNATPTLPEGLSFAWVAALGPRAFFVWVSDGVTPWRRLVISADSWPEVPS
ncbi:MAG TPA: hypothetical protein VHV50_01510, partial [Actinomycetota bacterium]|nr:hypothetical protein [Actinomycetota bacterium]